MNHTMKIRIKREYLSLHAFFMFLLALVPIVQPLNEIASVSNSMLILVLTTPYVAFLVFKSGKLEIASSIPIVLYCMYRILNHGTSFPEMLSLLFVVLLTIALWNDLLNMEMIFKFAEFFAMVGAIAIILQTVVYYIFGLHIVVLQNAWLREELRLYEVLLSTGISGGMYRPCGIFTEPSAMTVYSFPILFFLIYKDGSKKALQKAALISLGVVASTSGMGIALIMGLWGLLFLTKSYSRNRFNKKWGMLTVILVFVVIAACIFYEPLRNSIIRIFSGFGDNQYSAIQGRVGSGAYYISQLSTRELIMGTGSTGEELTMYLSGMYSIIYTDGIIGYAFYVFIFICFFRKNIRLKKWFPLLVCALSIVSDITLIHYLIYYFIACIYCTRKMNETESLELSVR